MSDDELGKLVRQVWLDFCKEQQFPTSHSHSAVWEDLTHQEQEVDRRIGKALYAAGQAAQRAADAAVCRARGAAYFGAHTPGWVSVEHECEQCAAAIEAANLPAPGVDAP